MRFPLRARHNETFSLVQKRMPSSLMCRCQVSSQLWLTVLLCAAEETVSRHKGVMTECDKLSLTTCQSSTPRGCLL